MYVEDWLDGGGLFPSLYPTLVVLQDQRCDGEEISQMEEGRDAGELCDAPWERGTLFRITSRSRVSCLARERRGSVFHLEFTIRGGDQADPVPKRGQGRSFFINRFTLGTVVT